MYEELFHAYQRTVYPDMGLYCEGKPGFTNMEFEAKLFTDIYSSRHGGILIGSFGLPDQYTDKYTKWASSVANEGLTEEFLKEYVTMLNNFARLRGKPYGNLVKPELGTPQAILHAMTLAPTDCD